jgi:hypothetical protein
MTPVRNVMIHTIMVEEYVPLKREPIHSFILFIMCIICLYLYDLMIEMYQ